MGRMLETILCVLVLVFVMALSFRIAKRPGISVAMGILNRVIMVFFYGYIIAECFLPGGWKLKWVFPAALLIIFLSFAVAWVRVKKTRVKLSIKKDVKPNEYIINSCEKLVVIATLEDLTGGSNVREMWFDFLLANVRKYAKEKHLTALVMGKYYVIPFQKYVVEKIDKTKYEECFCLVWMKKAPLIGWGNIEPKLKRLEKSGFKVILCERCKTISKQVLYRRWPAYSNTQMVIPYEIAQHYETQKNLKQYYLQMHKQFVNSKNSCLKKYINELCSAVSLEEQFYILMEIARWYEMDDLPEQIKQIDFLHKSTMGSVDVELLKNLAETVLHKLQKQQQISDAPSEIQSGVKITTCREKEYQNIGVKEEQKAGEELAKAKTAFIKQYKRSSVWGLHGKEDVFRGWSKGLNGKYMTPIRFEKDYMEKILKEEPTPEYYHELLMKLDTNRAIHLLDGESWDAMHKSWFSSIKIEEAYVSNLMMDGEFLPMAPVKVALLHKGKYDLKNLFPWIRSLEIMEFKEREDLIRWIRHDSIETAAFEERSKIYREALKEMGCESVFLNSNVYLVGLYKNAFDHRDEITSAMSFLDFMEYALINVKCVLMEMEDGAVFDKILIPDFQSMGDYILQHAKEGSVLHERTHCGVITLPEECQNLHKILGKYLHIEIEGQEMDFQSLVQILHQIRMKTQQQLFVDREYKEALWKILLYYSIMMNRFLDLYNFGIRVDNTKVWAGYIEGYEDGYIRTRKYFIEDGAVPCPVWEVQNGDKKYINYFYGRYVTPQSMITEE